MTDTLSRTDWTTADLIDPADLHLERRRLVGEYLKAREAWEDETGTAEAYLTVREATVHALIACGEYTDDVTARSDLDALTAGFAGEMFVQRWAASVGHLEHLDARKVNAIADRVRDCVADGACLDQLPMWDLAEPYLNPETDR